jgi:predicted DsbA family dithiol-disulfide isomerase
VRPIFEGYAKQIGLDVERFQTRLHSDRVEHESFSTANARARWVVNSTPTVFINESGSAVSVVAPETLRVLIDNELRAASQK